MKSSQPKQTTQPCAVPSTGFGLIQRGIGGAQHGFADVSPALAFTPRLMVTVFSCP